MSSDVSAEVTTNPIDPLELELRRVLRLGHRARKNRIVGSPQTIEVECRLGVRPGKSGTDPQKWMNVYNYLKKLVLTIRETKAPGFVQKRGVDPVRLKSLIHTEVVEEYAAKAIINAARESGDNEDTDLGDVIRSGLHPESGQQLSEDELVSYVKQEAFKTTNKVGKVIAMRNRPVASMDPEAVVRASKAYKISMEKLPKWDMYFSNYASLNVVVEPGGAEFRLRIDESNEHDPDNQPWQAKKVLDKVDMSDYWLRLSVATEDFSAEPAGVKERRKEVMDTAVKRYISRHTFIVNNVRFDLSIVNMGGIETHEVEAEYIFSKAKSKDEADIRLFVDTVKGAMRAIYHTPILFTFEEYRAMSTFVNDKLATSKVKVSKEAGGHIDRRFFSEAKTLTSYMVNEQLFQKDPGEIFEKSFHVGLKVDGERIFLVICELGTWLVYPPFKSALHAKSEQHAGRKLTIVDGELVNGDTFWYIDCLFLEGISYRGDVGTPSYRERMDKFVEWRNSMLDLPAVSVPTLREITNLVHPISTAPDYERDSDEEEEEITSLASSSRTTIKLAAAKALAAYNIEVTAAMSADTEPHPLLGDIKIRFKATAIISGDLGVDRDQFEVFKEVWASRAYYLSNLADKASALGFLVDGMTLTPNYPTYNESIDPKKRIIYKWKPVVTSDFKVKKNNGDYKLYSVGEGKIDVLFQGTPTIPFTGSVVINESKIVFGDGGIVEFKYKAPKDDPFGEDRGGGNLKAIRARTDKTSANGIGVVLENWEVMVEPVTEDVLFCNNDVLMRKSHNRLKVASFAKGGGILLDIGGGQGGDISKVKHYSKIIVIDTDKKAIKRYRDRLNAYKKKDDAHRKLADKIFIKRIKGEKTRKIKKFLIECGVEDAKVDVISMFDSLTFFYNRDGKAFSGLAKTINSFLKEDGLFIWKAMDGDQVNQAMDTLQTDVLTFGRVYEDGTQDKVERINKKYRDSTVSNSKDSSDEDYDVRVVIKPKIAQKEYFVSISRLKAACGLVGETQLVDTEHFLSDDYLRLSKLFTYGIFTKGNGVKLPKQLYDIFGDTNVNEKFGASKYLIAAVESIFTSKQHEFYLDGYVKLAREVDQAYFASGNKPAYTRYETANVGYWASTYLNKLVGDNYKREEDIVRENLVSMNSEDKVLKYSLGFCSLLNIDVFVLEPVDKWNNKDTAVVNYDKRTYKIKDTNSVVNSSNVCLIAIYNPKEKVYKVETREGRISPFYQAGHAVIEKFKRRDRPVFKDLYYDIISADGLNFKERINTTSNILERLCYIKSLDSVVNDDSPNIRLLCLANKLANDGIKCDSSIIERLQGFDKSNVSEVNAMIMYLTTEDTEEVEKVIEPEVRKAKRKEESATSSESASESKEESKEESASESAEDSVVSTQDYSSSESVEVKSKKATSKTKSRRKKSDTTSTESSE